MKNNALLALLFLLIFISFYQDTNTATPPMDPGQPPTSSLIDGDVSFTGVNKYVPGASLSGELVRVFRINGNDADLGTKSLNSGTLSVTPNVDYLFYFFMNESAPTVNYYVDRQEYTAKVQDSVDNVKGIGCEVDDSPTVSVRNPSGVTQTSRTNAYAMGAAASANFEIDIKAHSDKCYGTPGAPEKNIVCFGFDATDISVVKTNTGFQSVPKSIGTLTPISSAQDSLMCYSFDLLEDTQKDTLTVEVTSNGDPGNNISIYTDDIGFDLNRVTLEEIWGFTDEDGNQLARVVSSTPDGYIYLS